MGTTTTPRHRATAAGPAMWANLRRRMAGLLTGRDRSTDHATLRPVTATDAAPDGPGATGGLLRGSA